MSTHGPRGDQGVRGESGEQGPKGERGPQGRNLAALIAFVLLAIGGYWAFTAQSGRITDNGTRIDRNAAIVQRNIERRRTVALATAKADLRICRQIENLKAVISSVVQKNAPNPRIAYYRDHPKELAQARQATADALRSFRPLSCTALPSTKVLAKDNR